MVDDEGLTTGTHDEPKDAGIDLARYRTGDLAERLTELLSVPEAFRKVAMTMLLLLLLSLGVCYLIHRYADVALLPMLLVSAYSLAMGVVFGFVLGILRVISTALQNVESILRIVLETTGSVSGDYERLQSGAMRLPSGGELVEQVYGDVVMPVIERVVSETFGFLASPLLWTYRRTIGSAVRYLVKRVDRTQELAHEQHLDPDAEIGSAPVAKYTDSIKSYTSSASDLVGTIGTAIHFYALLPVYAMFLLALAVAVIPIVLGVYFGGG